MEAASRPGANNPIKIGRFRYDSYYTIFWACMSLISSYANMFLLLLTSLSSKINEESVECWPIPVVFVLLMVVFTFSGLILRRDGFIYDDDRSKMTIGEIWISNNLITGQIWISNNLTRLLLHISIIPLFYSTSNNLENDIRTLRWIISLCFTPFSLSRLHRCRVDYGVFKSFMTLAIATFVNFIFTSIQ